MALIKHKSAKSVDINICGENVRFNEDGIGEISDEKAKAAGSIQGYSLVEDKKPEGGEKKGKDKTPSAPEPKE